MNSLLEPDYSRNLNLAKYNDASWPAIVDLIFEIIAHRDRLAIKRNALGKHKRKLARKHKRQAAQ